MDAVTYMYDSGEGFAHEWAAECPVHPEHLVRACMLPYMSSAKSPRQELARWAIAAQAQAQANARAQLVAQTHTQAQAPVEHHFAETMSVKRLLGGAPALECAAKRSRPLAEVQACRP